MSAKAEIRAKALEIQKVFMDRGAIPVETDVLQPAEVLLDLYGEDIRARAFVTQDPLHGETMLRPDFTVPVAQMHLASMANEARYTYSGEVFRRQEDDETRAREYIQVGYENFGESDPAQQDADVFLAIREALSGVAVRPVLGDVGIISALIDDLETPERRKAALRRHIWRPVRFRALLDRFSKPGEMPAVDIPDVQQVGLRGRAEVEARLEILRQEAQTQPLSGDMLAHINDVLAVAGPAGISVERLMKFATPGSSLATAVDAIGARLDALGDMAADAHFAAAYGLTTMEYYGGFVFGFVASDADPVAPAMPPVATGGRYDMVTGVLGRHVPAVGGVVRPDLLLELSS